MKPTMPEVYWLTNLNSQFTEIASKKPCWSVHEEIYNVTQDIASMKQSSSWIGKYLKSFKGQLKHVLYLGITIFSKCSKGDRWIVRTELKTCGQWFCGYNARSKYDYSKNRISTVLPISLFFFWVGGEETRGVTVNMVLTFSEIFVLNVQKFIACNDFKFWLQFGF